MLVLLRGVLEERRLCSAIFSHVQPLAQRVRETSIGATCKEPPAEKGDEANVIVSGHETTKARARRSTRGISKDYGVLRQLSDGIIYARYQASRMRPGP
jgi:hypothetical protein